EAFDAFLDPEFSAVVYTGNNNDPPQMKKWHLDEKTEKQIRKNFIKFGQQPNILIVTEKLLTGFDAPILYAMYLDKPMRDHTLLQAIARVNRPYENEREEMVKPHGFVLDFVGIFDKLERRWHSTATKRMPSSRISACSSSFSKPRWKPR